MKLFYSATSPYVRKVVMSAMLRDIDARITRVPCNPHDSPAELLAVNPLSKVPTLLTDDGVGIYDSPLIIEFLDGVGEAAPLIPATGPMRLRALREQAIGDGLMDAAVLRRMEMGRAEDDHRTRVKDRQRDVVARTLAAIEADPPHAAADIGTVTLACALGYLDFRFAHEPWRDANPRLAAWLDVFARRPAYALTAPADPA